jgi:hypothetical protein
LKQVAFIAAAIAMFAAKLRPTRFAGSDQFGSGAFMRLRTKGLDVAGKAEQEPESGRRSDFCAMGNP